MDYRKCYIERKGVFVPDDFWNIKEKDLVRLEESTGEEVGIFMATSDAYLREDGLWGFDSLIVEGASGV